MVNDDEINDLRQRIGQIGIWLSKLGLETASRERLTVKEIEQLGFKTLWIGEGSGNKEVLVHAGLLLSASEKLIVATGIANIWARDATAMNSAANTLAEAYDSRLLLGLGISHSQQVNPRGHEYKSPLQTMRQYLIDMDNASYISPKPAKQVPRMLAALREKMLKLAGEETAGAHTYFITPLHTQRSRQILGKKALLAPEQAFIIEKNPGKARELARIHMSFYLELPNYVNNLLELGFTDEDIQGGGSDRLVDAIVAWGDVDTIRRRILEHLDAGADHVAIQPLASPGELGIEQVKRIAPALRDIASHHTSLAT